MTHDSGRPDGLARGVAHIVVGAAAAAVTVYIVGKKVRSQAKIIAALIAVGFHEWLDAPLAGVLTQEGW